MANQLYGYSSSGGYGGASAYTSRSLADQYLSADSSSFLSSSRYFGSDTLSSSSAYSSITDRTLFNHTDPITGTASRIAGSQQLWPGPPGVDIATSAASVDPLYAGLKRSASEAALYHQTLLGAHNTIGQSEAWFSTNPLVKRPRFESTSNLPIYPQRPGEKDCAHYMLTRTCKFGESCKFDHPIWVPEGGIPDWKEVPISATNEPLPERPGEPDCPYFLKTQRCKFGLRCKFNHPKDKENASLLALENADVSALPERPSEPHCAFYLKTGKCKFGPTCKFHHPRDILVPFATEENVNDMQNEANKNGTGGLATSLPIFTPALMHNSKGLPIRPGEADCPFYLKTGSCKYGATCRYNHPDRFAISVPGAIGPAIVATPAAHLNIGVLNPSASMLQPIDPRLTQTTLALAPNIYPQRPGQIECDFYMKTGVCKFVERCKFHHPIDRSTNALPGIEAQQINVKLTLAGLPRREGAINCPYYMKTGACKYGATCKFDHPPPGEVMATATSQGALMTSGGEENDSQREVETVQE